MNRKLNYNWPTKINKIPNNILQKSARALITTKKELVLLKHLYSSA